jgi:hypothetical protein
MLEKGGFGEYVCWSCVQALWGTAGGPLVASYSDGNSTARLLVRTEHLKKQKYLSQARASGKIPCSK